MRLPALALTLLAPALLHAQQVEVEAPELPRLPLDEPVTVTVDAETPRTDFLFEAPEPGYLFVVFRLEPQVDCFVTVLGPSLQRVPGNSLGGRRDHPAEQHVSASLPVAGGYRVRVMRALKHDTRATFVAHFLPFVPAAEDRDRDAATPPEAALLELDAPLEQRLAPTDRWDWLRVPVTETGALVVRVVARSEGRFGLKLDSYRDEPRPDDPPTLKGRYGRWDPNRHVLRVEGVQAGEVIYLKLELAWGKAPVDCTLRAVVEPLSVEQE